MSFYAVGTQHSAEGFYWEGDEETLLEHCKFPVNHHDSCGFMIQQAGWEVPDNYPIKL